MHDLIMWGKHKPSSEVARCISHALRFAVDGDSAFIETKHLVAGMYVCSLERLSRYWPDGKNFERLVAPKCGVEGPRWLHWTRWYDSQVAALRRTWRIGSWFFWFGKEAATLYASRKHSPELETIYRLTDEFLDGISSSTEILPEDLLFIIATGEFEMGRHLRESGLDVARLEKDVRGRRE